MGNVLYGDEKTDRMSASAFIAELKAYFVDIDFREVDERRISTLFSKYKTTTVVKREIVERPVYREKLVYLDHNGKVVARQSEEQKKNVLNPDQLIREISELWELNPDDVRSPRRKGFLPDCRFMIMMILKDYGYGVQAIGEILGRDHSTVCTGIRQAFNKLDTGYEPFTSLWFKWKQKEKNG